MATPISGNRVVRQARPGSAGIEILGVDLSNGTPFTATIGPGNQTMPDTSGTIVVWQDDSGTNSQVRYRDLAGGTEQPVVATGGPAPPGRAPQISGRRVVWQQQQNRSWDID